MKSWYAEQFTKPVKNKCEYIRKIKDLIFNEKSLSGANSFDKSTLEFLINKLNYAERK